MKRTAPLLILVLLLALAGPTHAEMVYVLTPDNGGYIEYNVLWSSGFDQQRDPEHGYTQFDTDDPVDLQYDMGYGQVQQYSSVRTGWLDFGTDYATKTITGVWLGFNNGNGGSATYTGDYLNDIWWDANNDGTKDGSTDTTLLSAFNDTTVPQYTTATWCQMYDGSFTVPQRYLMVAFENTTVGTGPGTQSREWIFQTIPEPATMGLMAIGGLALLRRRRI